MEEEEEFDQQELYTNDYDGPRGDSKKGIVKNISFVRLTPLERFKQSITDEIRKYEGMKEATDLGYWTSKFTADTPLTMHVPTMAAVIMFFRRFSKDGIEITPEYYSGKYIDQYLSRMFPGKNENEITPLMKERIYMTFVRYGEFLNT
jgi:hypothetical protein